MKNINKTILMLGIVFVMVFLSGILVEGYSPNCKIGYDCDISIQCTVNGTYCSSASCNVSIINPNGTVLYNNVPMTNTGGIFNITIEKEKIGGITGTYSLTTFCKQDGFSNSNTFDFFVNYGGTELNQPNSNLILALIIGIIALIGFFTFLTVKLDDKLLFLKYGFFVMIFLLFLFLTGTLKVVANNYLTTNGISSLLTTLYQVSIWITIIVCTSVFVILLVQTIAHAKEKRLRRVFEDDWEEQW